MIVGGLVGMLILNGCDMLSQIPWGINEEQPAGDSTLVLTLHNPPGVLMITPGVSEYTFTYYIVTIFYNRAIISQ